MLCWGDWGYVGAARGGGLEVSGAVLGGPRGVQVPPWGSLHSPTGFRGIWMLPWWSWHLPGGSGTPTFCSGGPRVLPQGPLHPPRGFRGVWVLPWGVPGISSCCPGVKRVAGEDLGSPLGCWQGSRGTSAGARRGLLTFKSLWTMNFWWQYCTADTICRRGGCQGGAPLRGREGHRAIPPSPLGTQGSVTQGMSHQRPPDLSKLRPGLLLLHAPVGHQVVENLT